jgi:IS5 family transposase
MSTTVKAPKALNFTHAKGYRNKLLTEKQKAKNRAKSKVRAIVEHSFLTIKHLFTFTKVRYKGLRKNAHRFFVACGLANLHRARRFLLQQDRRCVHCWMKPLERPGNNA